MWSEAYKQAAIIPSAAGAALVAWLPAITAGGQTLFSPLLSIFWELKVGVYFFPGAQSGTRNSRVKQQQIIFLPIIPYRTLPSYITLYLWSIWCEGRLVKIRDGHVRGYWGIVESTETSLGQIRRADREMNCAQEEVSDSGHHNGEWLWRPELSHMTSAPGDDPFRLWMRVNWKCMWRSPARRAELHKQSFIVRVWEALWWRFWEHREPLWKLWQEVSLALIMTDTDLSCWPPFFRPHSFMTIAHKHTFPKHTAHCTLKSCEMFIETIVRLCFIRHVLQPCNVPESSRVVGCGFVV